ncbi:hypothetical protein IMZ31_20860 (plasmid) [Pontibacillus sp. ALD_SL1]|uniref:JAB domain-containing protein n=1 Tax=Pontibacillus sp. ALD_SL1 TaxID=2777185 RepID=UPI001A978C03|nr:JAB domain-containing protein [Pontibacillus sp. ALD_SL1]QST03001.1 hypothetical protein IMZ31_20860 [Pontibacillus sp. ALD_SL1]
MKTHIKEIWNVFKPLRHEKQMLFSMESDGLHPYPISKNEDKISGTLDRQALIRATSEMRSSKVMVVHNHPYHQPDPSMQDRIQATYISSLLNLLGVEVYDYGIVSPYGFFSFASNDILPPQHVQTVAEAKPLTEQWPTFVYGEDVLEHGSFLGQKVKECTEVIYTPSAAYIGQPLSTSFLAERHKDFSRKCLLFIGDNHCENRYSLLSSLIEPIETYRISDQQCLALKK